MSRSKTLLKIRMEELIEDNKDILKFVEEKGEWSNLLEKRYDNNIELIEEAKKILNKK